MKTSFVTIAADFDPGSKSHSATNNAIAHCAAASGVGIKFRWIATTELARPHGLDILAESRGIWIGPGSPYQSMEGALTVIRLARERGIPLLGTCGGFQH